MLNISYNKFCQYYLLCHNILHCTDFDEDLADVIGVLSGLAPRWRDLTINLRLKHDSMNIIESECSQNVTRCLQRAIEDWLKLNYKYKTNGVPSWRMLAKAVRNLNGSVFEKIVSEHPGTYIKMYRISY